MNGNRRRGEIAAELDGRPFKLPDTGRRSPSWNRPMPQPTSASWWSAFRTGRLSATDLIRVVGAGLRGAGHPVEDEAVRAIQAQNGAALEK
jgi:hypothetical protein